MTNNINLHFTSISGESLTQIFILSKLLWQTSDKSAVKVLYNSRKCRERWMYIFSPPPTSKWTWTVTAGISTQLVFVFFSDNHGCYLTPSVLCAYLSMYHLFYFNCFVLILPERPHLWVIDQSNLSLSVSERINNYLFASGVTGRN